MDVSILIINWNTRDILRDCLKSVYRQTSSIHFETIVVDNASSDGSVEMIQREYPQVILIKNDRNRGFAAANNQGIAIAQGRYVLLLNSDTVILDRAVSKTLAFADQHPEAAVVGCRVLNPDRTLQPTCFLFPSLLNLFLSSTYLYKIFPQSRFFGREQMTWWDRNDVRQVEAVTGCFMLVRKKSIEQVGMMDEKYFMYAEEADWCYRFQKAGWKNLFFPDAQIIHLGGQSTRKVSSEMTVCLRLSLLLFFQKHYSKLCYRAAQALFFFWFFVRIPYWYCISIISNDKRLEAKSVCRTYWKGCRSVYGVR